MASPSSKTELKSYCLRELGDDVIKINVSDAQIDDRIDEALQLFIEYHYDATYRNYYSYQITSSDITNKYITLPSSIVEVVSLMSIGSASNSANQFSDQYQFELAAYMTLMDANGGLLDYTLTKQKLSQLQSTLNPKKIIDFNFHSKRLYIYSEFGIDIKENDYILLDCYTSLDADTFSDVWNNRWLKEYTTQLIKKQWGSNLSKFDNVQLLNGMTLNGQEIYNEAVQRLEILKEELINTYQEPPQGIYIG